MRILLDECLNVEVNRAFPDVAVQTITDVGWSGLEDGPLLSRVHGNFDVFITIDKSIEFQQNYRRFPFAIVVVHVRRGDIESWTPFFPELRRVAERVRPDELLNI